jgi:hypothetical protein
MVRRAHAAYGLPLSWAISPVLVGAIFLVGYKRVWWQLEQWLRMTEAFQKLPTTPEWAGGEVNAPALLKWRPHWHHRGADPDARSKSDPHR